MLSVAARLRQALQDNPDIRSIADLAIRAGKRPGTVRKYFDEGPDGRYPPLDVAEDLGRILGHRGRWLREGKGPKRFSDPDPKATATKEEAVVTRVPLIGMVAAGRLANPNTQIPVEDVPLLAFADLGAGEFFATKVDGTSMDRISPDGSTIIANRADRDLVTGKFYIFLYKGPGAATYETTYKRWQGGDPSYLDPYSTDASHKPIFIRRKRDFEVIARVKRSLVDL